MPLYEYRCLECGERIEVLQRVSDAPLAACGRCGGRVQKLLSAPALQFRGSGWYITEYARKSNGEGSPGGKEGEPQKAAGGKPAEGAESQSAPPKEASSTAPAAP